MEKEMVVVGSKVKAYIKEKGMQSSGDLLDALNDLVHWHLDKAVERTKSNGRATVRAGDI
jgi:hypothetical protein